MTKEIIIEEFEGEITWEEDLENCLEGLDVGGSYCCDGRECMCEGETKSSVIKRAVKGYLTTQKEELKKKIEGKRKEMKTFTLNNMNDIFYIKDNKLKKLEGGEDNKVLKIKLGLWARIKLFFTGSIW